MSGICPTIGQFAVAVTISALGAGGLLLISDNTYGWQKEPGKNRYEKQLDGTYRDTYTTRDLLLGFALMFRLFFLTLLFFLVAFCDHPA